MSERPPGQPDLDAFPALKKLQVDSRRRVPVVRGHQWSDCGAACLAMTLQYYGREVRLSEVRDVTGVDRDGVDALSILRAAEWYGLRGRGIRLEVEDLDYLQPGAILHWELNHFVVLDRIRRRGVDICDPAHGRRFIPMEKFRRSFTGVALILEPTESFEPGAAEGNRLTAYMKKLLGQRHLIGRIVITSILLRLFALALPILTGLVVDRVVPRSDHHFLLVIGAGLGAMVVFQLLASLIRAHLLLQLRTNLDSRMTLGFVDYLVSLPYEFFQRRPAGDLMMRVNSNATIREILTSNTLSALLDGSMAVIYLVLIMVASWSLGLLVLGIGVLQVAVYLGFRGKYRELMAQNLEAQARSQAYLVQLVGGIETLKTAGAEHRAVEHWSNLFVSELNVSLQRGRLAAVVDSLMGALQTAGPLVVLGYGALLVMDGQLSLGFMLALSALATGFLRPLTELVNAALQLQLLGGYVERIDDVMSTEPEEDRSTVTRAPAFTGAIKVDEVTFRYGPQAPPAVREVSLTIRPGQTVALVGRSGSGKSTLAKLLLGLYRPDDGRILYDDRDLRELGVLSVRRQLGIVPQHPYIFGASIRDNIALTDPSLSLDRVVEAARLACIHRDIVGMPMGYETVVSDGGASLSGGQRQRLALARALVHRPSILLLDEATSSLDTETELAVMKNLASLSSTRVVIAHRLSTIINADVIVVMEQGRIAEIGSHRTLLANGGVYADLIAAQTDLDRGGAA
jgi:ABC-type bacteriocin/lantibiotic exporter with double-glycine peptidase domain